MQARMLRVACLGLLAGTALVALKLPASSAPYVLNDNYYGGTNTYNNNPPVSGDVIESPGTHTFEITDAQVSRTNNGNTLQVVIDTNFAGAPASGTGAPAFGTTYGSLFFASATAWTTATGGPGNAPYSTDTFHPGLWSSAFVMKNQTTGPNAGTLYGANASGTGGLYSIGATQTAHNYPGFTTPDYYTTTTGNIVMSNVGGNPISYPNTGNPNDYFRQGQAVQFNPTGSQVDGGTWAVDAANGKVTYTINDNGYLNTLYGGTFAISWAMTCANDIIQGIIPPLGGGGQGSTPLPAAFPLFISGLGVMGFFGSRRKRRTAQAAASAA